MRYKLAADRPQPDTWRIGRGLSVGYDDDGLYVSTRVAHILVADTEITAFVDAVNAARDARRAELG